MGPGRLESCWSCRRPVFLAERLVAGGKLRHRTCFTCVRCGHQLNLVGCYETESGDFVCETCPDEEKREQQRLPSPATRPSAMDTTDSTTKNKTDLSDDLKDEYSLNFELELEKESGDASKNSEVMMNATDLNDSNVNIGDENQRNTASDEDDKNFDLKAEVSAVIDEIILNAVERVKVREGVVDENVEVMEGIVEEKVEAMEGIVEEKVKEEEAKDSGEKEEEIVEPEQNMEVVVEEIKEEIEQKKEEVTEKKEEPKEKEESPPKDYPDDLNPFADEEETVKPSPPPRKAPPIPTTRQKRPVSLNKNGQKIIEAPVVNLNPFWSDGEPSSEDEKTEKPTPIPRQTLRTPEPSPQPFLRGSKYGSNTSLSSLGSSISTSRRKKGPAPPPPVMPSPSSPNSSASSPSGYGSRSPVAKAKHRKSRPAPPPPVSFESPTNTLLKEKKGKDYENKMKQNLSFPDKSTYGKWKRKKGQAPGLPIPQRRRITPLPLPDLYRELEDLEVQQRELERQGVTIEQTIRQHEIDNENTNENVIENMNAEVNEDKGKDVEGLILQLFEIVNQKNELFRKQAELMYLRRQQRLEEEHADLEYQIRCLMGRPERNKTDSDKAQEEDLIKRLVEVVERRNEIIECLDMDRRREVEEDKSIHHHLEVFAGKGTPEELEKPSSKHSPSLLKFIKKKKLKKEKIKDSPPRVRRDADKDIDEAVKEEDTKTLKSKKKWFAKP